jgi:hypothetical protein
MNLGQAVAGEDVEPRLPFSRAVTCSLTEAHLPHDLDIGRRASLLPYVAAAPHSANCECTSFVAHSRSAKSSNVLLAAR